MPDLTASHVGALAAALGLSVPEGDLAEIAHRLNALLDALAPLGELALAEADPRPTREEPAP